MLTEWLTDIENVLEEGGEVSVASLSTAKLFYELRKETIKHVHAKNIYNELCVHSVLFLYSEHFKQTVVLVMLCR